LRQEKRNDRLERGTISCTSSGGKREGRKQQNPVPLRGKRCISRTTRRRKGKNPTEKKGRDGAGGRTRSGKRERKGYNKRREIRGGGKVKETSNLHVVIAMFCGCGRKKGAMRWKRLSRKTSTKGGGQKGLLFWRG